VVKISTGGRCALEFDVVTREITHRYVDPLDRIWLGAARACGLQVVRSSEVFASTDGEGLLCIGAADTLDPDDCLAQMVFHELAHWMVQGENARSQADWGLQNTDGSDEVRERACLRLQAVLLSPFGLRQVLAPTTDFRLFYDGLSEDPARGATGLERELLEGALARSTRPPWQPWLNRALKATQAIGLAVRDAGFDESDAEGLAALWDLMQCGEADEL